MTLKKTTAQDLLLDLGPPLRKYWKEDDRLNRVWAQHTETTEQTSTPCFWNYFQYGIDFLIVDGTVTKLIVHSNIVSLEGVSHTHISPGLRSFSSTPVARGWCKPTTDRWT